MSSRKKGKRVMLDTPGDQSDISEFTPGTMDLQGKVDSDNTAVLSTDDSPFAPLSMADWVSPATTAAPAGNAYEQQWSRIRPDRDPSVSNSTMPTGGLRLTTHRFLKMTVAPTLGAVVDNLERHRLTGRVRFSSASKARVHHRPR